MSFAFLIVNFGGPRNIDEIPEFLSSLLTDKDVIWTGWPDCLQDWLFRRIAKRRAKTLVHDYMQIGGRSPIFETTENLASQLTSSSGKEVFTFHRYLPKTHKHFLEKINECKEERLIVFPLFPQFSYATTGSVARWFQDNLSEATLNKLAWIKSYPDHPDFIISQTELITSFLSNYALVPEETLLFFSAHGLPKCFVCLGDTYEQECEKSFEALTEKFPQFPSLLAYQSKFGPGQWLRPYTQEMCEEVREKNTVFIPLSFTSDHIETLFEIEQQYLPIVRKKGVNAYRCPALGLQNSWIRAIPKIALTSPLFQNKDLIRQSLRQKLCENKCKAGCQSHTK